MENEELIVLLNSAGDPIGTAEKSAGHHGSTPLHEENVSPELSKRHIGASISLSHFSFGAAISQNFVLEVRRALEHLGAPAHLTSGFRILREIVGMKIRQSSITVPVHNQLVNRRIGLCNAL